MKKIIALILLFSVFVVNFSVLAVEGNRSEQEWQLQSLANDEKTGFNENKELGGILVPKKKLNKPRVTVVNNLSKYLLKKALVTGAKLIAFSAACYGAYKIGDKTGFNENLMSFVRSETVSKFLLGAGVIGGVTGVALSVPVVLSYFDKNFYQNYGEFYVFFVAGPLVAFTAFASLLVLSQV